jgi:hypothetical protein
MGFGLGYEKNWTTGKGTLNADMSLPKPKAGISAVEWYAVSCEKLRPLI